MHSKQILTLVALAQITLAAPITQSDIAVKRNDASPSIGQAGSNCQIIDTTFLSGGQVLGTLSCNGNGNSANGNGNGNNIGNTSGKRTTTPPSVGQAGSDCKISDLTYGSGGQVLGTLSCNGNGNSANGNGNNNNIGNVKGEPITVAPAVNLSPTVNV